MSSRSLETLLRVRSIRERAALVEFADRQRAVRELTDERDSASAELGETVLVAQRSVPRLQSTVARRAATAARMRMISDSLMLAELRSSESREAWLEADRRRESAQRLVDEDAERRAVERDDAERKEMDDLSLARRNSRQEPQP